MTSHSAPSQLEVALFTRQLAVLFNSGVDLLSALYALERGAGGPALAEMCAGLARQLRQGRPLSSAVQDYPEAFSGVFSSVLRSGEQSGALGQCLLRLADQLERDAQRLRRLSSTFIYPAFILALTGGLCVVLFGWVIPVLFTFLPSSDGLPMLTRCLIFLVGLLHNRVVWVVWLALGMELLLTIRKLRHSQNRQRLGQFLYGLPVLGPVLLKSSLAAFCGSLATLLGTGAPLLRSLSLAAEGCGNPRLCQEMVGVQKEIKGGEMLSACLRARSSIFPVFLAEAVACAEEAGNLPKMLDSVERMLALEVSESLETLGLLLEPLLLAVVSGIVALVLLGVFIPLYLSLGSLSG